MNHLRAGSLMAVVLMGMGLLVGGVAARDANSQAPIIGPTSWVDDLADPSGLAWLQNTVQLDGKVHLSPMEVLGEQVGFIQSLVEGGDSLFYLGTDEARLWSVDPVTGQTTDLGTPVPGECNN